MVDVASCRERKWQLTTILLSYIRCLMNPFCNSGLKMICCFCFEEIKCAREECGSTGQLVQPKVESVSWNKEQNRVVFGFNL